MEEWLALTPSTELAVWCNYALQLGFSRLRGVGALTGQVPPVMIRSKDRASGIPKEILLELSELTVDPPMDCLFSSLKTEVLAESTWGGRR